MVSEHASPLATLGGVDSGGQNVHVAALARACARRGHHVTVYTRRDDASLARRIPTMRGLDVVHVDAGPPEPIPKDDIYPHVPQLASELVCEWANDPPDIVHAHFWMSGLASLHAGRATGVPVALTFHALGITKRTWQGAADTSPPERVDEEARLARECDRLIATANHETFDLVRMGAPRSRVSLVPCGVDLDLFRADARAAATPKRRRRFRVLCVSRLVARKGIDTVIDAIAQLPDAELVVAGGPPRGNLCDDPEGHRLLIRADERGVANRVRFLGQVAPHALPALYRSADVVVCTPWYEPFGMVALEAMACGVPTVVSAVGGLVDTVIDGVTGLHVPPREPDGLAHALRALLDDPARRAAMADRAATTAQHRYGWQTIAADTVRAYVAAMDTGVRRRRSVG
jgi:glycosyltransferase involved in cell wall biosynthesis